MNLKWILGGNAKQKHYSFWYDRLFDSAKNIRDYGIRKEYYRFVCMDLMAVMYNESIRYPSDLGNWKWEYVEPDQNPGECWSEEIFSELNNTI